MPLGIRSFQEWYKLLPLLSASRYSFPFFPPVATHSPSFRQSLLIPLLSASRYSFPFFPPVAITFYLFPPVADPYLRHGISSRSPLPVRLPRQSSPSLPKS
jgi:hypothetical protein